MKRLVLVGGGHAHLFVLEAFARAPLHDVELVLLSPLRLAPYSGMMPGVLAGHYRYAQACVDLAPLAQAARCRWLQTRAMSIDAARRTIVCADGTRLDYDLLSLDTGSTPGTFGIAGVAEHVLPVKPIDVFALRWQAICDGVAARPARICVVGGGAAGCEVVCALQHRLPAADYTLLSDQPALLANFPATCGQRVARHFHARGIALHLGNAVDRIDTDGIALADDTRLATDLAVWATGSAAPPWPREAGLATDAQGFVLVDACLRSVSHPEVFAAGDLASMAGAPRPKSGVYAVRAGPPLARNLRAALSGQALEDWTPQRRALALLSLGERRAIAVWSGLCWEGDWVWRWKDRIDRRFIARFTT